MRRVIKIGKIKNFVEGVFDDYRNNRITLKQLIIRLCSYADTNIMYEWLWTIFVEELNKQFDEEDNISY